MANSQRKTDLRSNPRLHDLATFAAAFEDHADIDELHRRGQLLISQHEESTDLAELAAVYVDNSEHRAELLRSAREVLAMPLDPMHPRTRKAIGCYLLVLGIALLSIAPWAWSLGSQVVESGNLKASFLWFDFTATPPMALIAIVILVAMIGSVAVMTLVFSLRAGNRTLEEGFLWWYLTRPILAASLAVLFYLVAVAGFLDFTAAQRSSDLVVAAALAALAGLFTDQVFNKLYSVLGLLTPTEGAAGKQAGKQSGAIT